MRVILIQATLSPVFAVVDETGRAVQTFGLPEKGWVLHYGDLAGLQQRVEQFETEQTAGLAKAGEEWNGETDSGAAQEAAEQGVRPPG